MQGTVREFLGVAKAVSSEPPAFETRQVAQ